MSRIFFLAAVLNCALLCRAAPAGDASLRDAWLQSPKPPGSGWNRLALLRRMVEHVELKGMLRTKVLELFGAPGYSAQDFPPPASRMDFYRLSAANDRSFRVDYDTDDKATGDSIEDSACSCNFCAAGAPVVPAAVLDASLLTRAVQPQRNLTMSALERMLGRRGETHTSQSPAGGRIWFGYTETWRVGGVGSRWLIATGRIPLTSAQTRELRDKPVDDWSLVSYSPECLAK